MTEPATTAAETASGETTPPPAETATTTTTTTEEFDKDRAMALIAKLREEAKEAKAKAKDADEMKARLDAIEAEKLSDAERLQKERDDALERAKALDATARENAIKLAVYGQRDALGLSSADLAIAALDRSKVEFDEQGQPTNVTDLLTALIEREPVLKGTPAKVVVPSTDGAAGGTKAPDLTADELEAARTTGMDPEKFAAIKRLKGEGTTVRVSDAIEALRTRT